jgi:hypothetical protein
MTRYFRLIAGLGALLAAAAGAARADALIVGPIPVTGGGTVYYTPGVLNGTISVSGTNGTDNVLATLSFMVPSSEVGGSVIGAGGLECVDAAIDGIGAYSSPGGSCSAEFGGGGGFIEVSDSGLVASATLISWLDWGPESDYQSGPPPDFPFYIESVTVSSSPEPATMILSALGLVALVLRRAR